MRTLLGWMGTAAARRPVAVITVLTALTLGFGALLPSLEVEVDLTRFGREDAEVVQTMDRVREEFADPTAAVQVILDAGADGDMLSADGLRALTVAQDIIVDALGPDLRREDGEPHLVSLATPVRAALAGRDVDPAAADDAQIGAVAGRLIESSPQLAASVSDDLDLDTGTARAAVLLALLDPDLTESERTDAAERVKAAFDGDQPGVTALTGLRVTVFSNGLFVSGLLDAIRAELPLLFALALMVVLAILTAMYRSAFDVIVGLAGLLATVVWALGSAAILGPTFLGWIGPLSQLVVVIPVLLVGLGIDYSVHLTARYREQRTGGQDPQAAAARALGTVGAALVLATAGTAVGFASIAVAPLEMLADFGLLVAIGVIGAFVIMGLLVPAARVWRDQRSHTQGEDGGAPAVRELPLARHMSRPIALAQRYPVAGLVVAAVFVSASLLASAGLDVEFDRDDFIPAGSDVETTLAHQEELFGGGVTESTFVVVDGDLADPTVANAISAARRAVGDIDGVRTVGGSPQVNTSTKADRTALVQIRTTTGDAGAERMRREVQAAFAPVVRSGTTVAVTSEPIIIGQMSEELAAFQLQAIALTLAIVLGLLASYYGIAHRRPLLGAIAMIPAVVCAALILGTMWALGISFNVLTATLTAIAVGIGVPYGVHVVNRFVEDLETTPAEEAVARTLRSTGGALTGSALTTLGALVVLSFSGLPPIRSLGLLGGTAIAFALLAAVLVEPGALVLWARRVERDPTPSRPTGSRRGT